MELNTLTIAVLVGTGVIVGIINTFAGAGATISMMVYSWLGVDLQTANATNRVSVLLQTTTMSVEFLRQKRLNLRDGLLFSIPTVTGSVFGAMSVSLINKSAFTVGLCTVLLLMLCVLIFNPTRFLKEGLQRRPAQWHHYALLLLIGFYGGAFHIGVGYLFLWMFIGAMGYELMQANALKGFVVLPYTLTSLVVFGAMGEIEWIFGLIHGAGNIVGAYLAAHYSQYMPIKVLRFALVAFIALTLAYIITTNFIL